MRVERLRFPSTVLRRGGLRDVAVCRLRPGSWRGAMLVPPPARSGVRSDAGVRMMPG
jgi:hypothetical protein